MIGDDPSPTLQNPPDPFLRTGSDRRGVKVSLPVIEVRAEDRSWMIGSILRVPDGPMRASGWPAVVIVHGSNGVDSRGGAYAAALNDVGVVSLEIDLWTARGVAAPASRPRSPVETLPDAFASLSYLAARGDIDPGRIGLMGFSWGGLVTMLAATSNMQSRFGQDGLSFAAFAPFYPVCWAYNEVPGLEFRGLTGRPILIQAGALDRYDDPDSCERLAASLSEEDRVALSVITYPNATHAWDRREPDMIAHDPFSHKGAGGPTPFSYDEDTTRRSSAAVTAFFTKALARPSPVETP
jgi:dienelactone hydrolase